MSLCLWGHHLVLCTAAASDFANVGLQAASECLCNLCRRNPKHLFGRLRLEGFLIVLILGLILVSLLVFCITRVNKLTIMHIPFAQLHVTDESEVLGEGMHGKVLRGEYRGTQIAVKRMLPAHSSRYGALLFCRAAPGMWATQVVLPDQHVLLLLP